MVDPSFLPDRPDGTSEPLPDPTPTRPFQVGDTVRVSEAARFDSPQWKLALGKVGKIVDIAEWGIHDGVDLTIYSVQVEGVPVVLCYTEELMLVKAVRDA